jgi:hypothetical protein
VIKPLEALTSEGAEAQMRVLAQSWILPNVFNVGNVVKQLIWTRMTWNTCSTFERTLDLVRFFARSCSSIPFLYR